MEKIVVKGRILNIDDNNYKKILLSQESSNCVNIDLIDVVKNVKEKALNKKVQVSYWISDNEFSENTISKKHLEKIYGKSIDAGYYDKSYMGSEWTGLVEIYESELSIGGHNFFDEFKNKDNKFAIIYFNILDK